jgi:alanine racemase
MPVKPAAEFTDRMYDLARIAEITRTTLKGANREITHFLHDSRSLQVAEGTLFVALKSSRDDGHAYIPSLINKGVKAFMVEENYVIPEKSAAGEISFIVSSSPLKSLQELATVHRSQFSIPVIGIAGSNGKTVVKEWLYQLLKDHYVICRSPKSYNSQIGVPLSVLNLNHTHTLAIFEAGISMAGEMDTLVSIIRPTIGVLTSFGSAHDEGFKSREEKLSEKLKLFAEADPVIVNGISKRKLPAAVRKKTVWVSDSDEADVKVVFEKNALNIRYGSELYYIRIPFSDDASVSNISTCIAVILKLGHGLNELAHRIADLQPVALRLEIRNGINNTTIINDYYNSDLDSLKIALNYLNQQNTRKRKIVIVSDIEQSGISSSELYRQLSLLFVLNKVDTVIGIGREIQKHHSFFDAGSMFFESTSGFISNFSTAVPLLRDAGILLKGARSFGFEKISALLELKSHHTVFEINLNRLTENINYYKGLVGKNVKIMAMVKAMGYGSGSAEISRTLKHVGINYLAVAYADEGVELRLGGADLPVMVMSPEPAAFDDMINYRLEPEIYSFSVLRAFAARLDMLGITDPFPVHIKIDTGMHRLGFLENETGELLRELEGLPQLRVQSVFSHLAGSDSAGHDEFTRMQISIFEKVVSQFKEKLDYPFLQHICNSGAITRFPEARFDMVRLGIGMYGIGVDAAEQKKLQNVGTLKSRITQIKTLAPGESVGYNRGGKISSPATIAIIPIGYADGFSRLLGNGRHGVYIHNQFCKTIGNICMDMCMVDVTGVKCNEGDEVIIFENTEQLNGLAQALNTIPYEVLTSVSARVKRVYVQE